MWNSSGHAVIVIGNIQMNVSQIGGGATSEMHIWTNGLEIGVVGAAERS